MAAKRVLRGTTIVVPSQHVQDALIWTSLDIRVVENFSSMKMGKIKFDGTLTSTPSGLFGIPILFIRRAFLLP